MGRAPEPSVEEVIAAIQQKATTSAIAKDISDPNGNFSTAMYASTSDNRDSCSGGFRGRGCRGRYQPYWKYCHHCNMINHNTKDCGKTPPDSESSSTLPTYDSRKCYYCTRQGHLEKDCRTKKAALELRKGRKTTSSSDITISNASLATAGAVAAADDVAPNSFN